MPPALCCASEAGLESSSNAEPRAPSLGAKVRTPLASSRRWSPLLPGSPPPHVPSRADLVCEALLVRRGPCSPPHIGCAAPVARAGAAGTRLLPRCLGALTRSKGVGNTAPKSGGGVARGICGRLRPRRAQTLTRESAQSARFDPAEPFRSGSGPPALPVGRIRSGAPNPAPPHRTTLVAPSLAHLCKA